MYTNEEDEHLIKFLAQKRPDGPGRMSKRLYEDLVTDADHSCPWSKTHSAEGWRSRYRDNQDWYDYKIKDTLKKQKQANKASQDSSNSKQKQANKTSQDPSTSSVNRTVYTEAEITQFTRFLAEKTTSQAERGKMAVYERLCHDTDELWSAGHSAADWLRHYLTNARVYESRVSKLLSSTSSVGPPGSQAHAKARPEILKSSTQDRSTSPTRPLPHTQNAVLVESGGDGHASPGGIRQRSRSVSSSPSQSPIASDDDTLLQPSMPESRTIKTLHGEGLSVPHPESDPVDEEEELASNDDRDSSRASDRGGSQIPNSPRQGGADRTNRRSAQKRPLVNGNDTDASDAPGISHSPPPTQQMKIRKLRRTHEFEDVQQAADISHSREAANRARQRAPSTGESMVGGSRSRRSKPALPLDKVPSLEQLKQRKRDTLHTNDATLGQLRAHARPHSGHMTPRASDSTSKPPGSRLDNIRATGNSSSRAPPFVDPFSASTASSLRAPHHTARRHSRKSFFDELPEPDGETSASSRVPHHDRRKSLVSRPASIFSSSVSPSNGDIDDSTWIAANSGRRLFEKLSEEYGVAVHVVESAFAKVDYDLELARQFLTGLNMTMRTYGSTWDAQRRQSSAFDQQGLQYSPAQE